MPTASQALSIATHQDCSGAEHLSATAAAPLVHQEWDLMFNAVTARLRDVAGLVTTLPGLATMPQLARARVLECAQALEQLHESLSLQHAQQAALQEQLLSVHGVLEQSRADLADTQDGERRQRHLAQHDALTALPNRSHFRNMLRHALVRTESERPGLALLFLDLDGFKPINDQHGHDVGDRMLRIVATRLTRAIRAGDCVGRMGGDEFVCLLGGIEDRQQLSHLACKLFDAVSAPLQIGKLQLTVRPSIGIAICPTDGGTADTLLKRADAAMYRAKREQLGYAFFDYQADTSATV